MIIKESDMQFGDYPPNTVFHIEKSDAYAKINNKGVKIAEFILFQNSKLYVIEAKTTAPNPNNKENQRFGEYIKEISEKMCNSLDLYLHQLA